MHLCKPTADRPQAPPGKRIVPAGVEDHHFEPRLRGFHLAQDGCGIDQLKADVGLRFGRRIDGHQIIGPVHLQSVPRIIENCDVRAVSVLSERLGQFIEVRLVDIDLRFASHQREAELLKGLRHQRSIVGRIRKTPDRPIVRIPDDEGHLRDRVSGNGDQTKRRGDQA